MKRTVIIGVGNPILGDDGIGIHVAKALKGRIDADIREAYTGGMNLLDLMGGYERAILVDAVYIDDMEVGEVRLMDLDELGTGHSSNPHDATLMEAVEMAKRLGESNIPEDIKLVGIKIQRVDEFSDELSPEIRASIPRVLETIGRLTK
jgi:hydrogenase maturation protease